MCDDAAAPTDIVAEAASTVAVVVADADAVAALATTPGAIIATTPYVAAAVVANADAIVCGCVCVHVEAPWDQLTTKDRKF